MVIETKYNIGDEVWFIKDNKVSHTWIYDIHKIEVSHQGRKDILYGLNSIGNFREDQLFSTKEELIKSL